MYYFLASAFETTINFDILFAKAITEPLHAVISLNLYMNNIFL